MSPWVLIIVVLGAWLSGNNGKAIDHVDMPSRVTCEAAAAKISAMRFENDDRVRFMTFCVERQP